MHTKLKQDYERLIKSKEFKNNGYLCGFFLMSEINDIDKTNWQIDFYNEKDDTITSYIIGEKIEISENSKIFKEETTKIEELKFNEIKTNFDDILRKSEILLKQHDEKAIKVIIILQSNEGPKWNISYLTERFNLLNIKFDAVTGEILDQKIISMLSFGKVDEGK